MPTEGDDPRWVNVPPVMAKCVEVLGQIEVFAPEGNAVLTCTLDGKSRISLAVFSMGANGMSELLGSTLAPMRRVAPVMQRKERLAMGFGFTRDGSCVAQFSTVPADAKKSAIRIWPVGAGERDWSQPDEEVSKGLAGVARAAPGKLLGLARYYNEHIADNAAQLILESDMTVCPDGNRIATIDPKHHTIHILDRETSKEIFATPSGIDIAAFLAAANVKREIFDPYYEIGVGRVFWSLDGKRLLVRARISVNYAWGTGTFVKTIPPEPLLSAGDQSLDIVQERSSTTTVQVMGTSVLRIPPIHYDCVIVLDAE